MLFPENFLEWEWRADSGSGVSTFNVLLDRADARVWRISVLNSGAVGGVMTISYGAPNPSVSNVTIPPSGAVGLEPCGMLAGGNGFSISFDVNVTQWTVEWIRRVQ